MGLEQIELSKMLETAIVAARLAGQCALEELEFLKVSVKGEDELLTQADGKCQQIIVEKIKSTYPDHGFIAEEGIGGKIFKQAPRGGENIWWVIDPIDGTTNFAHKIMLFTVSVAALYEGEPVVGAIFEPATRLMFSAIKGGEARLNDRRIEVSDEAINKFSCIGLDSHFNENVPAWMMQLMKDCKFRNLGSAALQMAYVASGSLVGTLMQQVKLWDIAAGSLIVESAGGVVTNWKGGKIFAVEPEKYEGGELATIAANKKVHGKLLELVK